MNDMAGGLEFLDRGFAILREEEDIPVFVPHVGQCHGVEERKMFNIRKDERNSP